MTEQRIKISIDKRGDRLDTFLAEILPDFSRTQCQRLIKSGQVTVDGLPARSSLRLSGTEEIWVNIPELRDAELVPAGFLGNLLLLTRLASRRSVRPIDDRPGN